MQLWYNQQAAEGKAPGLTLGDYGFWVKKLVEVVG